MAVADIGVSFGKQFVDSAKQRFGVDLAVHRFDGKSFIRIHRRWATIRKLPRKSSKAYSMVTPCAATLSSTGIRPRSMSGKSEIMPDSRSQ